MLSVLRADMVLGGALRLFFSLQIRRCVLTSRMDLQELSEYVNRTLESNFNYMEISPATIQLITDAVIDAYGLEPSDDYQIDVSQDAQDPSKVNIDVTIRPNQALST